MSLDRTLKIHGAMARTRSVLTRAERIERLMEEGNFDPEKDEPFGLPKMKVRHSKAGTKTKKEKTPEEEAGVEGAEAAAEQSAEQAESE
ncbi:MAG: small basic protein [Phycisphaerae bacterium]